MALISRTKLTAAALALSLTAASVAAPQAFGETGPANPPAATGQDGNGANGGNGGKDGSSEKPKNDGSADTTDNGKTEDDKESSDQGKFVGGSAAGTAAALFLLPIALVAIAVGIVHSPIADMIVGGNREQQQQLRQLRAFLR